MTLSTDDLIRSLAADVHPVGASAALRRIGLGVGFGAVLTLVTLLVSLGLRADLGVATHGFAFWMKSAYTGALAAIAIGLTLGLSRPDAARSTRVVWLIAVPVVALAALSLLELSHTPRDQWLDLWRGRSAHVCPWLVLGLSVPIFVGLLWSFRRLAPTRLRATGTAAGFAAGALSATVYGLHCPESTATFVLTWYTLGIALAALLGRLLGPRLLRW
jgi:hypothetical protein